MRRTIIVAVSALVLFLAACGDGGSAEIAGGDDLDVSPWSPAGAPPVVVVDNPGDGATIEVRVGDRIRLASSDGPGGLMFEPREYEARTGLLVPYGDVSTFLAVAPGEVTVLDTVVDEDRPCVPPQPVAEFTVVIADGPRPDIPAPVEITTDDAGTTIELVPGQALSIGPDMAFSVDESGRGVVLDLDGRALRPGTVEVSVSDDPSPDSAEQWVSMTVVVADPDADLDGGDVREAAATWDATPVRFAVGAPTCG